MTEGMADRRYTGKARYGLWPKKKGCRSSNKCRKEGSRQIITACTWLDAPIVSRGRNTGGLEGAQNGQDLAHSWLPPFSFPMDKISNRTKGSSRGKNRERAHCRLQSGRAKPSIIFGQRWKEPARPRTRKARKIGGKRNQIARERAT